jgi:hypothetical protein
MNGLTWFGLLAVGLMLVFYALDRRSHWFILAFSGSCVLASVYGFLQGAWPFGLVEAVWSGVALRRWWLERRSALLAPLPQRQQNKDRRRYYGVLE